jgi:alcohol dehydrogenase class IV
LSCLGVSIFDLPEKECKTGIRLRAIKPLLAVVDPLNVMSMPKNVAIYSGFDVLCHALESYTAKPYTEVSFFLNMVFKILFLAFSSSKKSNGPASLPGLKSGQ